MTQSTISMNTDCKKSVKIDIVCGFRGSGKTTLIKRMEEKIWERECVVFLQNESGKENLSRISVRPDRHIRIVQQGCICCNGVHLLTQTLLDVVEEYQPDRIILEAAETARIENLRALISQRTDSGYEIEHIIYVCNAACFYKKMSVSRYFFENELKQAPVIFLNRVEDLAEDERDKVLQSLQKISPDSVIVKKNWSTMEADELQNAYESGRNIPPYATSERKHAYAKIVYRKGCGLPAGKPDSP